MDFDPRGPAPAQPSPHTPQSLAALADSIRRDGGPVVGLTIPLALRVNGNSPYLAITTEIRRHLDQRHADYRLTARSGSLDNGQVTWDLFLDRVANHNVTSLLDWLVPVYEIER